MNDLPETLKQLAARLTAVEQRVAALERGTAIDAPPASAISNIEAFGAPATAVAAPAIQAVSLFSVFGRAMLGIAGAYVLRAVAESGTLPRTIVAVAAIVYALAWLVAAARVQSAQWLPSTVYASTSALILAPMIWELTLRFDILPAPIAAAMLAGFVVAGSILASRPQSEPLVWVVNLAAALASIALGVATHRLIPFIGTLLLMALLAESAALLDRRPRLRLLTAAAADLTLCAFFFVYSGPADSRSQYPSLALFWLIAPACLLFLICASSTAVRTVLQRRTISVFETAQLIAAFLLVSFGLLQFVPHPAPFGIACLALSAVAYATLLLFFRRNASLRNLRVFSAWSAVLLLAGCWLLLSHLWLTAALIGAALIATPAGVHTARIAFQLHALAYLVAAAIAARLPIYTFQAIAAVLPARPTAAIYLVAAAPLVIYAILSRSPASTRFVRLVPAALAASAFAALLIQAVAALGLAADVYHLALDRTLTLCLVALLLAFAGARWLRAELTWLAYATLAFIASKLLFEDLRHGHLAFIAASIFVFALTLIAVPRLRRQSAAVPPI